MVKEKPSFEYNSRSSFKKSKRPKVMNSKNAVKYAPKNNPRLRSKPIPPIGGGSGDPNGNNGDNGNGGYDYPDEDYHYYYGWPWWPWWHCWHWWHGCSWHYWTPICWSYCSYSHYPSYWEVYWTPKKWTAYSTLYLDQYDYVETYPNIYTPAAFMIDPTSLSIEYIEQGARLFREGKYVDALHWFRLATLVDLDFAVPKLAYGQALFALGIYDYAAFEIRLGLDLLPEWLDIGGDLKLMYGDPQDFEEQLSALISYLKIWKDDEDALLVLGYISYFTGDLYLAEKTFEKLGNATAEDTAHIAGLFLDSIQEIKEGLAAEGKADTLKPDDGRTIDEILQK